MKIFFSALAAFALFALCLSGAANELRKAPELAFNVPGQGQKLLSQYVGKVVALEFIYTTCPHCQAASKMMSKIQQEYGARGLQVLAVAVNPNADLLVENFVKDYQVTFPVGWNTQDQAAAFMGLPSSYFVVPQLVLIDRKGYIHYQTPPKEDENWHKLMQEDAIRQHVQELLALGSNSASRRTSRATAAAMIR
jgi:peroxiredoxin